MYEKCCALSMGLFVYKEKKYVFCHSFIYSPFLHKYLDKLTILYIWHMLIQFINFLTWNAGIILYLTYTAAFPNNVNLKIRDLWMEKRFMILVQANQGKCSSSSLWSKALNGTLVHFNLLFFVFSFGLL